MEYIPKRNLFLQIPKRRGLTEDKAFWFFIQTCAGVYFMHKHGFIHRDLKPENLLIDDNHVIKLCDFGWTVESSQERDTEGYLYEGERQTYCGTLEYMAPEMINQMNYDHSIDTWALGILLYELIHGQAPFRGDNAGKITRGHRTMNIEFKDGVSDECKDLVLKLLQYDSDQRMPLIKVFSHPWILTYQAKLYPDWQVEDSSDEDDEDESSEYDEEEESEYTYDQEEVSVTVEENKTPGATPNDHCSENITYAEDDSMTPSGTPLGDNVSDATSRSYQK